MADSDTERDPNLWPGREASEQIDVRKATSPNPAFAEASKAYCATGEEYENALNLSYELAGLPEGSIIVDCGAGACTGPDDLQKQYPHLKFVGLNAHRLDAPGREIKIPRYDGLMEEFGSKVRPQMEDDGLWPPVVLLMKDMIHYPATDDTLPTVLEEAYRALPPGSKILIHNAFREHALGPAQARQRELYKQIAEANGSRERSFVLEELKSQEERGFPYLRLTKPAL